MNEQELAMLALLGAGTAAAGGLCPRPPWARAAARGLATAALAA